MRRKPPTPSTTSQDPPRRGRAEAPAPRPTAPASGALASRARQPAPALPSADERPEPVPSPATPRPGVRLIRRYGNRRLYDHRLSRGITVEDIAAYVRAGDDIQVIDETGADITKRILVQIILEDRTRAPLEHLPLSLLRAILQSPGEAAAAWLEQYLATGADWFQRWSRQAASLVTPSAPPWGWPFFGGGFPTAPPRPPTASTQGAEPSPADLKRRLEELERTLAELTRKKR